MIIKIETTNEELTTRADATMEGEVGGYPEVTAALMGALDAYCSRFLEGSEEGEIRAVHDYMSAVFSNFMLKHFPDTTEFGLSDAAIIKAQDDIIKSAVERDISVEEAVEEYNRLAEEYCEDKRNAGKMS